MITLESLLQSFRANAADLTLRSSVQREAWSFMMDVLDLGLLLEADPSRRPEIRGILDETTAHLHKEFGIIELFASDMESRRWSGWSDDPSMWKDLCMRRSAVAFFAELYEGTALAPKLSFLDQARLDVIMRDHAHHGFLPPEAIPAHMPTRHWWWWLPDDPPA